MKWQNVLIKRNKLPSSSTTAAGSLTETW